MKFSCHYFLNKSYSLQYCTLDINFYDEYSNPYFIDAIKKVKDKMEDMIISKHRKNIKEMNDCHENFSSPSFEMILAGIGLKDVAHFYEINSECSTIFSTFTINFSELKHKDNR